VDPPMLNPWFTIAYDAARLGFEAQLVIAARMIRLASGGTLAQSEMQRMVNEKAATFVEAQLAATAAAARGHKSAAVSKKILRTYRKRVGANRRRLSRRRKG
jgi:hypothetical protein